ncbi:MAG: group 1 glycosyl transferase [Parcubacteria group bacterium Gr01-1014_31]|nr:MAG: group 1 glycosyl transferase [Parcubacteria group bacterium Gr01-1014_31]
MKIAYIANIRLPTEKAHGYQIMRTCAALTAQGAEVTLVVPARRNPLGKTDPFTCYGIAQRFPIVRLPVVDLVGVARRLVGSLGFWIESFTFARAVKKYLRSHPADFVWGRDELILWLLGPLPMRVGVELHSLPKRKYRSLLTRAALIAVISRALGVGVARQYSVPAGKLVLTPDASDVVEFFPSQDASRDQLYLPRDRKIAVYVGHFYEWKGVQALAEAAGGLPAKDWLVVMVGGLGPDAAALQSYCQKIGVTNVKVVTHQPRTQVPLWLAAADVLVIPNSAKTERSRLYTSPLKLFEYLAAGRPIVASDLSSIREIVSEKEVVFAKPDDPQDLARAIREAGEYDQSAREGAAKKLAERYTWDGRATTILAALNALPKA